MAAKALTLLCCLASSGAITVWSDYTPSYSSGTRFIKAPKPAYVANNVQTFFGGNPYYTNMNYKPIFTSFSSPSFEGNQMYGTNSRRSKVMNAPSPNSHYLINEGLSAYKTEAMDAEHSVASYDYSTNSDAPIAQGSFRGLGASYSW